MLVLMPAAVMTGCGDDAADSSPTVETVREQRITAETIANLQPGEQFIVDQRIPGNAYTFDFSQAPIDFSRITMINAKGEAQPMDKWLSTARENGNDLLASQDHSFRMSSSAQGLGALSKKELSKLQSTGKVVRKAPSSREPGLKSAQDIICEYTEVYILICDSSGWCYEYLSVTVVCYEVEY
ncbi:MULTISPECIES: hypothetical protein [unclassified Corallococcus]|uniref:hypothetical protein n=1 Tax=unclassified Corallococcus TaxID=2685029 RepID=UPI001A8F1657|nr:MULTISPECIES: hypothetical protein [unclassified Corallococcus]MBN9686689.1 hypothetical protein [Corallococcus sp. NCSPR001]WAS81892.1 hypothetical protein O0N60_21425 [Corallococcus sp. NCRR]